MATARQRSEADGAAGWNTERRCIRVRLLEAIYFIGAYRFVSRYFSQNPIKKWNSWMSVVLATQWQRLILSYHFHFGTWLQCGSFQYDVHQPSVHTLDCRTLAMWYEMLISTDSISIWEQHNDCQYKQSDSIRPKTSTTFRISFVCWPQPIGTISWFLAAFISKCFENPLIYLLHYLCLTFSWSRTCNVIKTQPGCIALLGVWGNISNQRCFIWSPVNAQCPTVEIKNKTTHYKDVSTVCIFYATKDTSLGWLIKSFQLFSSSKPLIPGAPNYS